MPAAAHSRPDFGPEPRPARTRSLTSHHLFPVAVALWFGALFSLSSLAVSTSLFESTVVAIGFDRLVPAASPPLGHFARLLIAALFGLVGAGIGHLVARLVADARGPDRYGDTFYPAPEPAEQSFRVRPRDAHPDAPARRPISAHELTQELGAQPLAPESAWGEPTLADSNWDESFVPPRHVDPAAAPLALAEPAEDAPLPAWFTQPPRELDAPVVAPWAAPEPVADVPEVAAPVAEAHSAETYHAEAYDAEALHAEPHPAEVAAFADRPAETEMAPPAAEMAAEPEPVHAPVAEPAPSPVADPAYPDAWRTTAERIAHANPAALSHVELIERLAIALHKREGEADAGEVPVPAGSDADSTIRALREALTALRGN